MLPAERLGLSKPVCPGGFRPFLISSLTFKNIKPLTAESVNFSKSWERYLLKALTSRLLHNS
jgi:hypothetical protein